MLSGGGYPIHWSHTEGPLDREFKAGNGISSREYSPNIEVLHNCVHCFHSLGWIQKTRKQSESITELSRTQGPRLRVRLLKLRLSGRVRVLKIHEGIEVLGAGLGAGVLTEGSGNPNRFRSVQYSLNQYVLWLNSVQFRLLLRPALNWTVTICTVKYGMPGLGHDRIAVETSSFAQGR